MRHETSARIIRCSLAITATTIRSALREWGRSNICLKVAEGLDLICPKFAKL